MRIATVKRIPESIILVSKCGEWIQKVEIEKTLTRCPRCGSKFHGEKECKMYVKKARIVLQKPIQTWRRKREESKKMVELQGNKINKEDVQTHMKEGKELEILPLLNEGDKENMMENMEIAKEKDGGNKGKETNFESLEGNIIGSSNNTEEDCRGISSRDKGLLDTKFDYERGSDDELFQNDKLGSVRNLLDIIDNKITEEDNSMLMAPTTKDEVKRATFALHPHKAPRPDGVTMEFYQKCWKFMGKDIWLVVEEFRRKEQHGFTPSREIADSIITVAETMHSMKMSKMWINCIKHCVTSISYSIIVNGSIDGFFQATNGLRQGDHLSPFLFVLMAKILGRNIKKLVETGLWKGVLIHGSIDPISHSQFVDDTVLFGEASEKEAMAMKLLLSDYEKGSGQRMDIDKSLIYFFNTNIRMQSKIGEILGFLTGSFPMKYLGVQLDPGRYQNRMWEELINKYQAKASSWKNKWLTQVGRIQMIKYVLSVIPIYHMSCFRLSYKAAKELDSLLKKFLWEGA
ncbi:uncharacterized protein LOC131049990 [Cryptomeria japonica]|uniref:uncharacterized protein LOC131049990 n=1 Tax=Cryptomeria japonica TaxID=3369 RepID=UPI0027DA692B|nr:uncharacterized protein LOC131049990 [Cryptomeria japonica]